MNYCEKIHYTILNTEPAEFAVMVDDLLSQLPQNEVLKQHYHKRHRHNRSQRSNNIDGTGIARIVAVYLAHLLLASFSRSLESIAELTSFTSWSNSL